jgi:transposase-like protein
MDAATAPKTLQQAIVYFSDYENCRRAVESIRWPDGVIACPHCGSVSVYYLPNQRRWKCREGHPRAQFSLKVGTIFEDSPIGLEKWLPALWLLTNCKNGISSYELGRALGVTQKSAWYMLSRLRLALQGEDGGKLNGEVEVDETYIGGKARNMHEWKRRKLMGSKANRWAGKVAVMGLLERHGEKGSRVRTKVVPTVKRGDLLPHVDANVASGATVYTDALHSYATLRHDYEHKVIDHAVAYVDGQVHTNGLESYWSLLKRTLRGTYISVEPFHLFRYLDEQAFRFNERKETDAERFVLGLKGIVGRRLTYTALTGAELSER